MLQYLIDRIWVQARFTFDEGVVAVIVIVFVQTNDSEYFLHIIGVGHEARLTRRTRVSEALSSSCHRRLSISTLIHRIAASDLVR